MPLPDLNTAEGESIVQTCTTKVITPLRSFNHNIPTMVLRVVYWLLPGSQVCPKGIEQDVY